MTLGIWDWYAVHQENCKKLKSLFGKEIAGTTLQKKGLMQAAGGGVQELRVLTILVLSGAWCMVHRQGNGVETVE
jgi:hypothetical protein